MPPGGPPRFMPPMAPGGPDMNAPPMMPPVIPPAGNVQCTCGYILRKFRKQ